ncbi:MAG TPA: STAS/SEC14 domain-containing protein [Arthrobacter sp.]|nr:STAS/SEC14 domain-containing protein [Arthrobacter sp.]
MEPITVKGGKGTVELEDGGYIHLVWNRSVRIEEVDAHEAMATVNVVADGAEYPMLVDMATTESVSRQARAVFSIPCAASRIALLGSSPVDRVLANFFLSLHVPPCPTRFFTSRDDAMAWLLETRPS